MLPIAQTPPFNCSEPLRRNLLLSSGNGLRRLGVDEAASLLAILERSCLGRANTEALAVVRTTLAATVGVVDTASRDELLSSAVSD
jgi:hypothetical protein